MNYITSYYNISPCGRITFKSYLLGVSGEQETATRPFKNVRSIPIKISRTSLPSNSVFIYVLLISVLLMNDTCLQGSTRVHWLCCWNFGLSSCRAYLDKKWDCNCTGHRHVLLSIYSAFVLNLPGTVPLNVISSTSQSTFRTSLHQE